MPKKGTPRVDIAGIPTLKQGAADFSSGLPTYTIPDWPENESLQMILEGLPVIRRDDSDETN